MCLFFQLSKYITIPILLDWLKLADFVKLEESLNKSLSCKLIEYCDEYHEKFIASYFGETPIQLSMFLVLWLSKRKLFPASIDITNSFFDEFQIPSWKTIIWEKKHGKVVKIEDMVPFFQNVELVEVTPRVIGVDLLFQQMLPHCKQLKKLHVKTSEQLLSDMQGDSFKFVKGRSNRWLQSLLHSCSNLMTFQIDCGICPAIRFSSTPIVWCRSLECVDLHKANHKAYRRDYFMFAFHGGRKLKQLSVDDCDRLLLRTLLWYRCGETLADLSIRGIKGCTTLFKDINSVSPNITTLKLDNVASYKGLNLLSHLKNTTIISQQISSELSEIPAESLKTIICLRTINYVSFSLLPNLTELAITDCSYMYLAQIKEIAKYCPLINNLNVSNCENVSDVNEIFKNGRLTKLNLYNTAVQFYTELPEYSTLKILYYGGKFYGSEFVVDSLLEMFHSLKELYIKRVSNLDIPRGKVVKGVKVEFIY